MAKAPKAVKKTTVVKKVTKETKKLSLPAEAKQEEKQLLKEIKAIHRKGCRHQLRLHEMYKQYIEVQDKLTKLHSDNGGGSDSAFRVVTKATKPTTDKYFKEMHAIYKDKK